MVPFLTPFLGEGSPTKIDQKGKVGSLILTSLLEDLGNVWAELTVWKAGRRAAWTFLRPLGQM